MDVHHYRATKVPLCDINFQFPRPRLLVTHLNFLNNGVVVTFHNQIHSVY